MPLPKVVKGEGEAHEELAIWVRPKKQGEVPTLAKPYKTIISKWRFLRTETTDMLSGVQEICGILL